MSILIDLFKNNTVSKPSGQNRQIENVEPNTSQGINGNECACCSLCKNRINRLEMMINELYSYMS